MGVIREEEEVRTKKVGYTKAEWAALNREPRSYSNGGGARGSRDRTPESGAPRSRCAQAPCMCRHEPRCCCAKVSAGLVHDV